MLNLVGRPVHFKHKLKIPASGMIGSWADDTIGEKDPCKNVKDGTEYPCVKEIDTGRTSDKGWTGRRVAGRTAVSRGRWWSRPACVLFKEKFTVDTESVVMEVLSEGEVHC